MVKAFLFNEFIHHRIQVFGGISAEGILDEGPRILIDINFGQVCRRLSDNSLHNGRVSALISPKERGRIYKALKPNGSSHLLPRCLNTVGFVFALVNIENTRTYSLASRIRSIKGEKEDARYGLSWTNIQLR